MHLDATTTRAEPWLCEPQHWERAHAHRVERNVETYHGSEYGLMLKGIMAGREALAEKLIPEFHLVISELFAA